MHVGCHYVFSCKQPPSCHRSHSLCKICFSQCQVSHQLCWGDRGCWHCVSCKYGFVRMLCIYTYVCRDQLPYKTIYGDTQYLQIDLMLFDDEYVQFILIMCICYGPITNPARFKASRWFSKKGLPAFKWASLSEP